MSQTLSDTTDVATAYEAPIVIVSSDTHIGPRLESDLRTYCPASHLEEFDDYAAKVQANRRAMMESMTTFDFIEIEPDKWVRAGQNIKTAGHYDVHARLRDMDYDGVAAEVIFHGSTNDEPIPFSAISAEFFSGNAPDNPELAALGRHIYNAWLADVCSVEPERHVALAQIPIWDIDASVREMEWARSVGLRGVNFPSPQKWFPQYNKPLYEPLWSAAEALEMPLVTHLGAAGDVDYSGDDGLYIQLFEDALFTGRRIFPYLIYSGVFERYPNLKLGITEIPGCWWPQLLRDMDSIWNLRNPYSTSSAIKKICPKPPSEYCRTNVFIGASFMSRIEAETASKDGYYGNFLWGSDYPHIEGTYLYPDSEGQTPQTHIALSNTFHDLPQEHVRAMLGENAIRLFDLDRDKLQSVAERIGAPSVEKINHQLPVPELAPSMAFRQNGLWD